MHDLTGALPELPPAAAVHADGLIHRWIHGVEYFHQVRADGGDLLLTRFGLHFAEHLQPENWLVGPWFQSHRQRLRGTSTIYRTQTKPRAGRVLDLVVRFSRVGEHVPLDTATRAEYTHAAFNSPFEEVAELMALRAARFGPGRCRIWTKRPLAIYSPSTRLELWQTQRSASEMAAKQMRMPEFDLDIHRAYVVVYGWIKGLDVQDAADHRALGGTARATLLSSTLEEVEMELAQAGFRVLDMKPAHIIVRFDRHGQPQRRRDGRLVYALVDYELLERVPVKPGTEDDQGAVAVSDSFSEMLWRDSA